MTIDQDQSKGVPPFGRDFLFVAPPIPGSFFRAGSYDYDPSVVTADHLPITEFGNLFVYLPPDQQTLLPHHRTQSRWRVSLANFPDLCGPPPLFNFLPPSPSTPLPYARHTTGFLPFFPHGRRPGPKYECSRDTPLSPSLRHLALPWFSKFFFPRASAQSSRP